MEKNPQGAMTAKERAESIQAQKVLDEEKQERKEKYKKAVREKLLDALLVIKNCIGDIDDSGYFIDNSTGMEEMDKWHDLAKAADYENLTLLILNSRDARGDDVPGVEEYECAIRSSSDDDENGGLYLRNFRMIQWERLYNGSLYGRADLDYLLGLITIAEG